ncbi:MAG TPA: hypothetical protein VIK14_14645 [Ignavibacteria bacterium]
MKPIVSFGSIIEALKKVLPERYHHLLKLNREALEAGQRLMKEVMVEESRKVKRFKIKS